MELTAILFYEPKAQVLTNKRYLTVTGTVLEDTEFRDILFTYYDVTPTNLQRNATAVGNPSIYVTYLSAAKEASSLHVTKKCVTNSYTYLNETSTKNLYVMNP